MQDLREKFSGELGKIDPHKEFKERALQLFKETPDRDTEKVLLIQDEIDKVKGKKNIYSNDKNIEFQYQFCTSDKHPSKNYTTELSPSSDLSFKSEIFFQAEQLLRILNSYTRKQKQNRRLSIACFDFIQDYTDRRWKFLNLKYFYTEDEEIGELDRELYLVKNTLNR